MSAQSMPEAAIDAGVIKAAGEWFAQLSDGDVSEADRQAWRRWREAHPEHERAWQKVEAVSRRFGMLLPAPGMAALDRGPSLARRHALKALVVVCAAGGAGVLGYRQAPWREWNADYRTATGERREIVLADGSRLTLNTASAANVRFDAGLRRVEMVQGELHIATGHDAQQRPFVVATPYGELVPLGTRFSVRMEADHVRLTVFEGAVQMRARAAPVAAGPVVQAGQSARLGNDGASQAAPAHESADAWTQGMLLADGMPLGELVAELARYRPGRLACDAQVAALRVSGSFSLDDTDQALRAAVRALPVRLHTITPYWVTVKPA